MTNDVTCVGQSALITDTRPGKVPVPTLPVDGSYLKGRKASHLSVFHLIRASLKRMVHVPLLSIFKSCSPSTNFFLSSTLSTFTSSTSHSLDTCLTSAYSFLNNPSFLIIILNLNLSFTLNRLKISFTLNCFKLSFTLTQCRNQL